MFGGKSYCETCFDKKVLNKKSYEILIKTICEYFQLSAPTGLMLKQVKQYKDEFNYTYDGMSYTLWYCKAILNKSFISKYGIAILKYEYENAERYFLQQQKIKDSTTDVINLAEPHVVKYKSIENKQNNFLLDLDELIKDGDSH